MKLLQKTYCDALQEHYEAHFGARGVRKNWVIRPTGKLPDDFYVLEIELDKKNSKWVYLTVGMSMDRTDGNLVELFVYASEQNNSIVELLTLNASCHRNSKPLHLHHTVNIGQPWLRSSKCNHEFISLPHLEESKLEVFRFQGKIFHCYWLIPITKKEKDYHTEYGYKLLERLFIDKELDFMNPDRKCLIED